MKLKNLLKDTEVNITYRTNGPPGICEDMLYGYCFWNGYKLSPLDGDNYSIEDEIDKYEWTSDRDLTVWYKSTWI